MIYVVPSLSNTNVKRTQPTYLHAKWTAYRANTNGLQARDNALVRKSGIRIWAERMIMEAREELLEQRGIKST